MLRKLALLTATAALALSSAHTALAGGAKSSKDQLQAAAPTASADENRIGDARRGFSDGN